MFFKRTFPFYFVLGKGMYARTDPRSERALPRGPYAVDAAVVAADQRRRLLAALPVVAAETGFEGATVASIARRAGVSPRAFYEQFADKRECFAVAYEAAQEKLLGVLTLQCYMRGSLEERVERSLEAGLHLLASEPELANLIAVEAPAVGGEIALRHHEWLDRYGRMLRFAALGAEHRRAPRPALESAMAGGIASQIASRVMRGDADGLRELAPQVGSYVLSFFDSPMAESQPEPEPAQRSVSEQPQSPLPAPVPEPAVA
jgi:AcrR family transcriptional regulator